MPSTIISTVGAANANSYVVDLAAANAYFDDQLNSSKWTAATDADKTRALLQAAARMQDENWLGNRVNTIQRLAWPRVAVAKTDQAGGWWYGLGYGGGYWFADYYRSDEIPQPVKDAQCEFALVLLSGGGGGAAAGTIESFTVDGLNVKFAGEGATSAVDDSRAKALIAGLVAGDVLVRA